MPIYILDGGREINLTNAEIRDIIYNTREQIDDVEMYADEGTPFESFIEECEGCFEFSLMRKHGFRDYDSCCETTLSYLEEYSNKRNIPPIIICGPYLKTDTLSYVSDYSETIGLPEIILHTLNELTISFYYKEKEVELYYYVVEIPIEYMKYPQLVSGLLRTLKYSSSFEDDRSLTDNMVTWIKSHKKLFLNNLVEWNSPLHMDDYNNHFRGSKAGILNYISRLRRQHKIEHI